jgi:hypothetical protein
VSRAERLTVAELCAELGISRSTFYEWRAKKRAPRCISCPTVTCGHGGRGSTAGSTRTRTRPMETSYDVRVFKVDVYEGTKPTSHTVRWSVCRPHTAGQHQIAR